MSASPLKADMRELPLSKTFPFSSGARGIDAVLRFAPGPRLNESYYGGGSCEAERTADPLHGAGIGN
jgi:hypothetical protein